MEQDKESSLNVDLVNSTFKLSELFEYYDLNTDNLKTVEDIALVLKALKFGFQKQHPFFEELNKRNLLTKRENDAMT